MAQKAHRYVYPDKRLDVPVHDLVDQPAEEARRRINAPIANAFGANAAAYGRRSRLRALTRNCQPTHDCARGAAFRTSERRHRQ